MTGAVLLTGATGFLGSAVARRLTARGCSVIGLARDPSTPRRLQPGDVAELRPISQLNRSPGEPIDAVIHTAASYGRHGETEAEVDQANVTLATQVAEAAISYGADLFVNTDTLLPAATSPYAASKARFRAWARKRVEQQSRLCFINLRIEQMYGPGDDESKFPSFVIGQCVRNVPQIALSPGAQQRDFVHVDDVVAAIELFVLGRPPLGAGFHSFEVGCGVPVTLRTFAESVREISGAQTRLDFGALPYRTNEVMHCVADPTALRSLGWKCRWDLPSGLRATIAAERAAS